MADRTQQILPGGQSSAPYIYTLPGSTSFELLAVEATYDGTSAAGAFLPCVQLYSDAGVLMARAIGASVNAGVSANASFFPWRRGAVGTPSVLTYYQVIAALASTNSLVAQWHLTDGADPFADTSGNSVGGNAQLLLQDFGAPITENYASGPLSTSPTGPSVRFNFDGLGPFNYLHTTLAPPSRFEFNPNAPYTVVAWVKPTAGANSHPGGVVGNVQVTNFGTPAEVDNGWQISVRSDTQECLLQRYGNVTVGHTPDQVSLGAMSTSLWTMVAMTYDGTTLRGYANGALVASTSSSAAIGDGRDAYVGITQAGPTGISSWYYGAVAEISVWAATLTAGDLGLMYVAATS